MEASVIVVVVMVVVDALCGYVYTQSDTTSKTTHPVHCSKSLAHKYCNFSLTLEIFGGLCFVSTFLL